MTKTDQATLSSQNAIPRKIVQVMAGPMNVVLALADDGTLWFSHVTLKLDGPPVPGSNPQVVGLRLGVPGKITGPSGQATMTDGWEQVEMGSLPEAKLSLLQ